ncbi:cell surface protein [uncultured Polaribacter sp.]|uniref:tetratricopeptide repeat protein n=1 Tax=uncultured Polaribacter sp. TaxID=174711 RepID=UPI00260958E6|nr:cell surface protein [uncultured Polaribacter sp.]
MKYIQLILLFVTCYLTISCNTQPNKKITNSKDYNQYLEMTSKSDLPKITSDYNFWKNKLSKTPNQYPYYAKLAAANSKKFQSTGNINDLKEAEKNLIIANEKTNYNNAGYLRSLARNFISQHRFKEALDLLTKAEYNGENLQRTHLMLVDVYVELGNYEKVSEYLSKVKNFKDFDYLIRLSKYNDHLGNLEKAIAYLEMSLKIAKSSKKNSLIQWNYTNLADYYGHAGRIKDSYNSYLKALAINPNDSYAKKGIAWIVFSYERNPKEALRILNTVTKENASPDYHLLKSEIADYVGDKVEKKHQIDSYWSKAKNTKYGVMYHKYDVLLLSEAQNDKAIVLAKQEVEERPTAQSYDLLAWAYFNNGQKEKALAIVDQHVIEKTFEPEALLHAALIFKANGKIPMAVTLKKELLGAVYELGPNVEAEINNI